MQQLKRIISMVLLLAILIGMVPATVQAEETNATVENTGATVEGTNGFGTLISEDIQDQQETNEEAAESGYNVVGLKIENGIATVDYSTQEEAILVVSLYTEDSVKMLLSGKAVVSPEETVAVIPLEGEIPEYFMAAAYLLDTYDHSPLCTAYETPMYTREMQELLASTTDDYEEDKVLQLDDDKTTNFAVYADSTIVLEYVEGVNTVVSANDETRTYVIENADSTVTGLQPGNILAYAYGEEQIMIVKVATVDVEGTTVTITGTDVEVEEVFSHLKIEATGNTADMTVDENSGDEGVTYVGMVEEPALMSLSDPYGVNAVGAIEDSVSGEVSAGFKVEEELGSSKLSASLLLKIEVGLSYYIAWQRQFIEAKVTTETTLSVEVSGKISIPVIKLDHIDVPTNVPCVSVGLEPTVSFIISAKLSANLKRTETIGFSYDSTLEREKIKDLSTPAEVVFTLDMEGTIFFGVDFAPNIKVSDPSLTITFLKASLSAQVGIELKAEMDGRAFGDVPIGKAPESVHNCQKCLKVKPYLKLEIGVSLKFFEVGGPVFKFKPKKWILDQWYRSGDQGWFQKGACPNLSYRVTVSVADAKGKQIAGSAVTAKPEGQADQIAIGSTNSSGIVANYLPAGEYTFTAQMSGQSVSKAVKIDGPAKVTLNKGVIDNGPPSFSGSVSPDSVTDDSQIIAAGECGDKGNNVNWTLLIGGLLRIRGQGAMMNYSEGAHPWAQYRSLINRVEISDGVTTIGNWAFDKCSSLTSVTIPDSVTSIGDYAFRKCSSLTSVTIPDGVTSIGRWAFYYSGLTGITIPDSVTTIGDNVFYDCDSLTSVTIGNSVTTIGSSAFAHCNRLTSVIIPNSVATIGESVFQACDGLISVALGDSVTTIGNFAFNSCDSLTNVTIGNSVTTIGNDAFSWCTNLASVIIPDSVTSIGNSAFWNCTSLARVMIGNGVTTIGEDAFNSCSSLTSVMIGESVTTISNDAFCNCSSLTSLIIPNSVTTIGDWAFFMCDSLTSVTIPNSVITIGDYAFSCDNLKVVYYTGTQEQWNAINMGPAFGNGVVIGSDVIVYFNSTAVARSAVAVSNEAEEPVQYTGTVSQDAPSLYSIFDGEYETEITETYTLKKASFSGLVPGEEYVLLSLVSVELEDVLVPENLLYIDQAAAAEDGTLTFAYAQRTDTDISYVMACGPSHQDLADAEITFPSMAADEELQAVHPSVVYDGKTLTEGVDYVITGAVDYTAVGEYTCYIRGIYDYTGLVECVYKVIDATASVTTEQGTVYYETLEQALQVYGEDGVLELQKDVEANITATKNMLLDLNGYDITGNVTANSNVEIAVMDSQTADFTVEDENGYGKILGTVSGLKAEDDYIMITEEDGVSFHCVDLTIKAMTLRPAESGVYFKSDFAGDELVAGKVEAFGVALSVKDVPNADNLGKTSLYSRFTQFNAGKQDAEVTSTLLRRVMKTTNADQVNHRNANMPVYGRAYILTADGEYIFGESVSRTFKEQVEAVDTMWSQLSETQQTAMEQMYEQFADVMDEWTLPNLKNTIY